MNEDQLTLNNNMELMFFIKKRTDVLKEEKLKYEAITKAF